MNTKSMKTFTDAVDQADSASEVMDYCRDKIPTNDLDTIAKLMTIVRTAVSRAKHGGVN